MTQVGAGPRFSAAPTALRSSSGLVPSPTGLGSSVGDRPSGPRIYCDFCTVISFSACHRQVACSHGRRDDKKKAGRVLWYPTQAKVRLDPDFLPRSAREVRVCAFHYGKAHGVYQRHKPPQEIGASGAPSDLLLVGKNAGPSASLGMTKGRALTFVRGVDQDRQRTAGPSTTLRSGRDDNLTLIRGFARINQVIASRDDKREGGDFCWERRPR